MRVKILVSVLALAVLSSGVMRAKDDPEKERKDIRKMAADTLKDLYKLQPAAQAAIQKSAGYAVFDNMGTNLLVVSSARGEGIGVRAQTKQETFMKMVSGGVGLGAGVKDYRVIFALQVTLHGTKYYKDDDLNKK
jgi:lipid-binding SYLF domain-containing protein